MVDAARALERASTVAFKSEAIDACWDEAVPIMRANHEETGAYSSEHFAPAKVKLQRLEDLGFIRLFTARRDGKLIGYQLFVVLFGINYPENLIATCHVAYVIPGERGYSAGKFLLWADRQLWNEGVYSIARQSTVKLDLSSVYRRLGYRKVEENWVAERGGDA